ncbi:chitobiase/beta-hexosaminidase C-terminal domain-containing protein [Duganella radicis]|nr:chitobiase/beta-hexosaminidase C-terminal domain-containing protein [Duganella radicis]
MKNHTCHPLLRRLPVLLATVCVFAGGPAMAATYTAVPNGQPYLDASGTHIQAHGGFVLKHEGVYYWVGEDKSHNAASFKAVAMYKSTDLENWERVGAVLTPDTVDVYGNHILSHCKIERPKLLFNQATNKFVLWGHWENYSSYGPSRVIVATADRPEGPYTITAKGHFRPGEGNSAGVGYLMGIPTPNLAKPPDADGNYPTFIPGYPSYPMTVASGAANAELANFGYSTTLKAVAVKLDGEGYPTPSRSAVAQADYVIGTAAGAALAPPAIYPQAGGATVVVNNNLKDNAYIVAGSPGATLYYTTDGSTPVAGAGTTKVYAEGTAIPLNAAKVIKAVSVKDGVISAVGTVSYRPADAGVAAPMYPPVISLPGGTYAGSIAAVKLYTVSDGTSIYFTADGRDPAPPVKGDNTGYGSRDYTLFQDPQTGKAYLVTAQDNVYLRVWQLTDDYTDVVPSTQYPMFINQSREAPALVRKGDYVYMMTSRQSGWYPNQLLYTRTADIGNKDGWEVQKSIGDNTGWHSQPTQVLDIGTAAAPEYLYLGDRWNPSLLGSSTYVWLPLDIDGAGNMEMRWTPETDIDLAKGKASGVGGQIVSNGKPVAATANVASTAAAPRTPDQANDGVFNLATAYYQPTGTPFYWQVDLGKNVDLGRLDLSLRSVGGSDAAHRYTVAVSQDGTTWTSQVDNSANTRVGFQSHNLNGSYRYVRVNVSQVWDMVHNASASWSAGIFEASVYSRPAAWNSTTADFGFEKPLTGSQLEQPAGSEWTFGAGAGIASNGSGMSAGNPVAPDGTQVAFIQRQGSIARDITGLVPGKTYRVSLKAAQRANTPGGQLGQTFDLLVSDASIGSFAPAQWATSYRPYSATFVATAAFASVKLQGTNLRGGDNTILLDQVHIDQVD